MFSRTLVEHHGAMSLALSQAQPVYLTPSKFQKKGKTQAFPDPGPLETTHGPEVVSGGRVLVKLTTKVGPKCITLNLNINDKK